MHFALLLFFFIHFIYNATKLQVQDSNGLVKVSHTKYQPQKGDAERDRCIILCRGSEWEGEKERGQDMTPKYGPFPATNNNARLVFYFIFFFILYAYIYIILNFSSSLNIWESIMPFQLANHVPQTNVMKGFISLLFAWSQPSGKFLWENPNERMDSASEEMIPF